MAKTPDASAAEKKRLADEKKKLKEEQKKQKKEAKKRAKEIEAQEAELSADDVLQHLLVQTQIGDETFEALILFLKLAKTA